MSAARDFPFFDRPDAPIAFAHRGGASDGGENSLTAFQAAYDLGYRYFETDVHGTSDGVLLAFHDRSLRRVTDDKGRLSRLTYAQVQKARIAGREPIPLLETLLEAFPDVRLNIDVKEPSAIGPLLDVLRRHSAYDRVLVGSFSDARLAVVRAAAGPRLATALGPREALGLLRDSRSSRRLGRSSAGVGAAAQVPERLGPLFVVRPSFVELAHQRGLEVHVWTVNDPSSMRRLLDLGVDGIMTDDVAALRTVLEARGQWHPPNAEHDDDDGADRRR